MARSPVTVIDEARLYRRAIGTLSVYDSVSGKVVLAVGTAVLSDIAFPSMLGQGETGVVTGYATNTGTIQLNLIVDLVDTDTGAVVDSVGPVSTIPQAPYFTFELSFVMPNRDFNFQLVLHD